MSHARGRIARIFQSGSATFGTGNCADPNRTQRNGSTYRTIQYVTITFTALRTGLTKAN